MTAPARSACRGLCRVLAASLLAAAPAWAAAPPQPLEARLDALVRLGDERPDEALAALAVLDAPTPAQQRARQLARGLVLARNGRESAARGVAGELRQPGSGVADPEAQAGADLVLATLSEIQGRPDRADEHALRALQTLDALCPRPAVPAPPPSCGDARLRWHVLQLADRGATRRGELAPAREALALARRLGDPWREARSLQTLIARLLDDDRPAEARALLGPLQALARTTADPTIAVTAALSEATVERAAGALAAARRALDRGLAAARGAALARAEAVLLVYVSDHDWHLGRPAAALQAAERALPAARRHGDVRAERALLHNRGLALIGLGRAAEGRRDIDAALALWERSGAHEDVSVALREYAQALVRLGDTAGALALLNRERRVHTDLIHDARDRALAELQARFQRSEQERELELRVRDNELRAAQLANQERLQGATGLLFAIVALTLVVIVALLLRMHRTQAALRERQLTLKDHSERDALTGLGNRRHVRLRLQELARLDDYRGALLLIDIDHFKQINDRHGHAAGDAVLVEIARRVRAAAGRAASVARWGGEEFLVDAPLDEPSAAEALARQLLHDIGEAAVPAGPGLRLAVTVSIGFGVFPLPPERAAIGWERALDLVDMALYSAKGHGRNQAVGLMACAAGDADALAALDGGFEQAHPHGRLVLARLTGPARPAAVAPAPQRA